MTYPHQSVLLQEILQGFEKPMKIFIDATLGAGGHSFAVLQTHPEIELLIGIDQDPLARKIAEERLSPWSEKVRIVAGNFSGLKQMLAKEGIREADGILFDLGVSSMQLDMPEKGFSFSKEGSLDMRMNPEAALTAEEIINTWTEGELGRVFRVYGEEPQWRKAARVIVSARQNTAIRTTSDLASLLRPVLINKSKKGINPLTLIFQGLRICVNGELEVLEKALPDAISCLKPGGRLGVISFHSLEDRIVKNVFRYEADDKEDTSGIGGVFLDKEPKVALVNRKPIVPSEAEANLNPRSRSAKLRLVEKL